MSHAVEQRTASIAALSRKTFARIGSANRDGNKKKTHAVQAGTLSRNRRGNAHACCRRIERKKDGCTLQRWSPRRFERPHAMMQSRRDGSHAPRCAQTGCYARLAGGARGWRDTNKGDAAHASIEEVAVSVRHAGRLIAMSAPHATLSANRSGEGPLVVAYQWKENGTRIGALGQRFTAQCRAAQADPSCAPAGSCPAASWH